MEKQIINFENFINSKKYAYDSKLKQWYAFEIKYNNIWSPITEIAIKKEIFNYCRAIEGRFFKPEEINQYTEELQIKLKRTMSQNLITMGGVTHNMKTEDFMPIMKPASNLNLVWYSPYIVFK